MSAEIWWTSVQGESNLNPALQQSFVQEPKLLSMRTKPFRKVTGSDLANNKFFSAADVKMWDNYSDDEKWAKMWAAFLISWIVTLMEGKPTAQPIDFYAWKAKQWKTKDPLSYYRWWLYEFAFRTCHTQVCSMFNPFRRFCISEKMIIDNKVTPDIVLWILELPYGQLIQGHVKLHTIDTLIDRVAVMRAIRETVIKSKAKQFHFQRRDMGYHVCTPERRHVIFIEMLKGTRIMAVFKLWVLITT